jgi:MFS family permease
MEERLLFSRENEKKELDWNVKDLVNLALCWALTLTTSTLLTTIGPLAAKRTGASDILAPFTIGTFLIGAAVSSVPSGPLFRKYGRYGGFAVGCACQIIGSAFGALAMIVDSQIFLYIGCFFVGLGQGLGQFYRSLSSLLSSALPSMLTLL